MRSSDEIPWWLRADLEIIGFEDEDDESEEDETDESEDEDEEDESEDEDDEDEEEEESEEDDDKSKSQKGKKKPANKGPNIDGLKSALRRERIKNRDLERRLRKLEKQPPPKDTKGGKGKQKETEEESEEPQVDRAQEQREQRLAARLRDNEVDSLIIQHAGDFQDVKDVLQLISRKEIEVDQDDEDPADITVDEESVIDAVKALAKKRPYLLKPKSERKPRSGSKMNGRRKKGSEPSDDQLRTKYSALRR